MGDSYVQSYSGFVGVDFTSDPAYVARNRLAHCVNMWRDYDSENGAAIETFPGFREVVGLDDSCGEILKAYHFRAEEKDYLIVHTSYGEIYGVDVETEKKEKLYSTDVSETRSVGFVQNNRLYILCDSGYFCVFMHENALQVHSAFPIVRGSWDFNHYNYNVNPISFPSHEISQKVEFYAVGERWNGIIINPNVTGLGRVYFLHPEFGPVLVYSENDAGIWEKGWNGVVELREGAYEIFFDNRCQRISESFLEWFEANAKCINNDVDNLVVDRPAAYPYVPIMYYNGKPYEQRNMLVDQCYQIETGGGFEALDEEAYNEALNQYTDPYDPALEGELERIKVKNTNVYIPILVKIKHQIISIILEDEPLTDYKIGSYVDDDGAHSDIRAVIISKEKIWDKDRSGWKKVSIKYHEIDALTFETIEEGAHRSVASLEYGGTSVDAILGCTKAAVYDGRVFLTGNPALPNTVFFSARNSTGANDPTYFGVYNYFNDGYGNTPNVDMLSTPSMLMVIKRDTVQDGSVYYHTGQDNTDDDSKNLIPRLYPSISGAAGLGSVGTLNSQGVLSCNFLDDTVFLTKRGLDGVSKEAVNLERTIGHRSYCVDKRLLKEDLSKASMAEWKGYLVICCNGHLYLADSRSRTQHSDGSYQYEWFYMEGLAARSEKQEYVYSSYAADEYFESYSIDKQRAGELVDADKEILDTNGTRYVEEDGVKYLVEALCYKPSDEKIKDVVAVGDRLFLISDRHIFLVNTDMERDELGRLTSEAYSFDECRYISGCSTKLDDCGRITVRKNTIYGLTVARFKTMRDSKCTVKTSINGVSFTSNLGEVTNFRQGFKDADYKNVSFDGDADNVAILPERSRGWIRKQYYFFSDRYCQPFGLYELSYHYQVAGKIR